VIGTEAPALRSLPAALAASETFVPVDPSPESPPRFVEIAVSASLDGATGLVTIGGRLSRAARATTLAATLFRSGEFVARLDYYFRTASFEADLVVPEAGAWSPDEPTVYRAVVELLVEGAIVDSIERTVEFRR
jgi:beta-galactosidase/beta-glucuronidase